MTTDKNNKDFDLSIMDQLSQDFNDEIHQFIFKNQEQCSEFDNALDNFHNKLLDNMKQRHNKEISIDQENVKQFCSDPSISKFSSNDKTLETIKNHKNQHDSLDAQDSHNTREHRYSESTAKNYIGRKENVISDFSEKGKIDSKSHNSSNNKIDIDSINLDNFVNLFEPIHTDKSFLPIKPSLTPTFKDNIEKATDKKTKKC